VTISTKARQTSATSASTTNCRLLRGATGTGGMAAVPPPNNCAAAIRPWPVPWSRASRPAIRSAAVASTVPDPTSSS
jgi:hypothetical protein